MTLVSGIRSGLRSGVRSGLNPTDEPPTLVTDGPDAVQVPRAAAGWTTLGLPVPIAHWNCDEASGPLVDAINSYALTPTATAPLYRQTITGWSSKFVGATDGTSSQAFENAATTALDVAGSQSYAMLVYAAFSAAATRRCFSMSGAFEAMAITAAGLQVVIHAGASTTGAVNHGGLTTVRPYILYRNSTTNVSGLMSSAENLAGGHFENSWNGVRSIGGSGVAAAGSRFCLAAIWKGADAETVATKTTLQTLGWTVPW